MVVVPDVTEAMSDAELRAAIAECVKALETIGADNPVSGRLVEGTNDPADQLSLMVARDHARFLLQKRGQKDNPVSSPDVYAGCDWCGRPIQYGNAVVTIARNIEQVDRTAENPQGQVSVIESNVLLQLCAQCGNGLNRELLRNYLRS